ncbi:hypothetical protein [Aeromicrobium sp. 50.2.37]|uniref:hypothetical protein n=1 Tax=Aeromicrobium sp. 50.2.37 TaxID=2969305 RepID=UPI00214FA1E1|nr:hypothetical protein [Aeromicrobium sp. 50.2.37]MCR4511790.1 hypothetical protein [Aeromicrobium sp. 50.2.37]
MHLLHRSRLRLAVVISTLALGSAACAGTDEDAAPGADVGQQLSGPRLVLTTDEGLLVLDRDSLEPVATLPSEGFVRVNPAGDDRHVLVSTAEGFQLLDTGVEVEAHGDHSHYAVAGAPRLGKTFEAPEPGHVTVHDGTTLLFSDGAGTIQELATDDPTTVVDTVELPAPHHGVAVNLDGDLLHTEGTADARSTVVLRGADGTEKARTDDCTGVHGEATAADGVAVVGCEDGVVVVRDGEMTKIDSPDAYGRIGNQAGSSSSRVVLGDYKVDADAELERPERISLVDTESDEIRLVDLGTSYSFRSLGRGAAGEALVLGTDGALHVLDAESGDRLDTIDVLEPWREPLDWQKPRPTLHVSGDTAWVTDPSTSTLHEVDVASGAVVDSVTLPAVPNEIVSAG